MRKKIKESLSIQAVKNPGRMILCAILIFNILFLLLSALVISSFSLEGTEKMSFLEAAFCTITMVLDAGCISYVVADIGTAGVAVTVFCLAVVIIGMISFTGAVIGYVTNYISGFIESSNSGRRKLVLYDHIAILNWNSRGAEIINDMLFSEGKKNIAVLVSSDKEAVEKEIEDRLSYTIAKENGKIKKRYEEYPFYKRFYNILTHRIKRNVNVIVREGDVFSLKELNDISLDKAASIIILSNAASESEEGKGNSQTIKALMQAADIAGSDSSRDNQKIIVEITDDWTNSLVEQISRIKNSKGKCEIIPVMINKIHGQILSQFCIMPELNMVYSELFSNKGLSFFADEAPVKGDFVTSYLKNHRRAIPVTKKTDGGKDVYFYIAGSTKDIESTSREDDSTAELEINRDFKAIPKSIIILGHNSRSKNIMDGFESFSEEWRPDDSEILNITVIDTEESLEKQNYYKDRSFVEKTVAANIYDKDIICSTIKDVVENAGRSISIMILSDDTIPGKETDSAALACLVYVKDIIRTLPEAVAANTDVIVEIINPKHNDIIKSYNKRHGNNKKDSIVISNKYISRMISQICDVESIFDLYNDILTYDDGTDGSYSSKEIYIKKAGEYFSVIPGATTADRLIRGVYKQEGSSNPTVVIGTVNRTTKKAELFSGDLSEIKVELEANDKIIVFTAH